MERFIGLVSTVLLLCAALPASAASLDIRLCPAEHLYTYPLDSSGRMKSLLLQGILIFNRNPKPVEITSIRLDLMRDGTAIDSRTLTREDIKRWGGNADGLAQYAKLAPFQFCGEVGASVVLSGPELNQNQALSIIREAFAFDGKRDGLRVHVDGTSQGHMISGDTSIPVRDGFAKNHYRFPLNGTWYVGWGPSFHTDHRMHPPEEFALDIAQLGPDAKTYRGSGRHFDDYYAYGADVLAAAGGTVVKAENNAPENPDAIQRPNETAQAYAERHVAEQKNIIAAGVDRAAGNYVLLDHGQGEYSLYAHLQPGSVRVHAGDRLKAGDILGKLGSSGNSTEPHLHFQVCDRPEVLMCSGIPFQFPEISILWADGPRALQSGDIVTAH